MTRWRGAVVAACCAALLVLGCGARDDDPILQLSSQEALEEGRKLMAESQWGPARRYFIHAFEVEPNSATGREGLLLAADAYFMSGGADNLIKAEARYRDFVNRFPTSENAAYAQFQIGLSLSRRIEKADRDQGVSREALGALEDVERFYPTSTYAAQAKQEIEVVLSHLAEHDYVVGRFYQRFGLPGSAIERYTYLLDNFPEYEQNDKVFYHLCQAYLARKAPGDVKYAQEACGWLENEHPESNYVAKIPKRWPEEQAAPEAASDTGSEEDDASDTPPASAPGPVGLDGGR